MDLGDLAKPILATLKSLCTLDETVGVSYRTAREVKDWLAANPIGLKLDKLACTPGAAELPPIAEALEAMGRKTPEAVAIGTDSLEVTQAHTSGVGAILLTDRPEDTVPHREPFTDGPDFIFHAGEIAERLYDHKKLYAGYVAEVLAASGHVPWLVDVKSGTASVFLFENDEAPHAPLHVCGRYFSTGDPRYSFHPLSLRLINGKKYPERQATLVAQILKHWNKVIKPGASLLCCIPPRPGESRNLIGMAIEKTTIDDLIKAEDLLRCIRDYPKQKAAGSPEARRNNVRGMFEVTADVAGKNVVVVDDITTSFSTLNEARYVLESAGAKAVFPVAIAFHPRKLEEGPAAPYPKCSKCSSSMATRFNKATGEPFFGCSSHSYKHGEQHPARSFLEVFREALGGV